MYAEASGSILNWSPMMPRDARLSDRYASDHCCYLDRVRRVKKKKKKRRSKKKNNKRLASFSSASLLFISLLLLKKRKKKDAVKKNK